MIVKVELVGFNGQNVTHNLSHNTLFIGPRGSGKSSVWKAIQFCLQSTASANLPTIFNSHYDQSSKTEKFAVTLTFDNDQTITRQLLRDETGKVSQVFFNNKKKKITRIEEGKLLEDIGITLPDINSFLELSDQRQIEYLVNLIPDGSGIDIERMNNEIDLNRQIEVDLQNTIRGQRLAIHKLEAELEAFPVPSGFTIKELKTAQANLDSQIAVLEAKLAEELRIANEAEAKRRAEEAAERARIAAEAKAKRDAEEVARQVEEEIKKREEASAAKARAEAEAKAQVEWQMRQKQLQTQAEEIRKQGTKEIKRTEGTEREVEGDNNQCKRCLSRIEDIIIIADKLLQCYVCGAKRMSLPVMLPLKILRNEIRKRQ